MARNGEFLAFMKAEDSSEGLFKVAVRRKVYKSLAGKGKTCTLLT